MSLPSNDARGYEELRAKLEKITAQEGMRLQDLVQKASKSESFYIQLKPSFTPEWAGEILQVIQEVQSISSTHDVISRRLSSDVQLLDDDIEIHGFAAKDRRPLRRLLIKLSQDTQRLPPSFVLNKISCDTYTPKKAGGFADIFLGTYRGRTVALKRLRNIHSESLLRSWCKRSGSVDAGTAPGSSMTE